MSGSSAARVALGLRRQSVSVLLLAGRLGDSQLATARVVAALQDYMHDQSLAIRWVQRNVAGAA